MATERTLLHTRRIEFNCYRLPDGLWEIEGELRDVRNYDTLVPEQTLLPAGESVHHMIVSVVVDDELTVKAVETRMQATPFRVCRDVENSLSSIIGARMGPGWRRTINERIGGTASCTHLRELLVNMATAAIQTVPTWKMQQHKRNGQVPHDVRPLNLEQCYSFRADGPVVKTYFPSFYSPQAPGKLSKKE